MNTKRIIHIFLFLITLGNNSYAQGELYPQLLGNNYTNNLVAYYHFDNDLVDSFGTNSFTSSASLTFNAGKINETLEDSLNGYGRVNLTSVFKTSDVTYGAWINLKSHAGGGTQTILAATPKGAHNPQKRGVALQTSSSGFIRLRVGTGTDAELLSSTVKIALNKWYFIVGTYKDNSMKVYINGFLNNTKTISGDIEWSDKPASTAPNPATFFVGGYRWDTAGFPLDAAKIWFSDMFIDEAFILNKELSSYEIWKLFASNTGRYLEQDNRLKPTTIGGF